LHGKEEFQAELSNGAQFTGIRQPTTAFYAAQASGSAVFANARTATLVAQSEL
jgi:hypothetical protein